MTRLLAALLAIGALDVAGRADQPQDKPARPLRVLLFAGGPTREYQFCRRLFVAGAERQQAELSICLQVTDPAGERVQDVPGEKLLKDFPMSLQDHFDLVIAFDPDWSRLEKDQLTGMEKWVKEQGGGLILVAGPVNTIGLVRPGNRDKLAPIVGLLPVELEDLRMSLLFTERTTRLPWRLNFTAAAKELSFLRLDDPTKPLSGWDDFFGRPRVIEKEPDPQVLARLIGELDSDRFDVREKASLELEKIGRPAILALEKLLSGKPSLEVRQRTERVLGTLVEKEKQANNELRGMYDLYPVLKVKTGATLLATFADPRTKLRDGSEHPYLATHTQGKGKVVYLGSGEIWRLRPYRAACYDRFWQELARWTASAK